MKTENISVPLPDGGMGAYVAYPEKTPAAAVIAIMEIWGVNDTMRHHARELAEAGYICLVPDLFWRLGPGVELSDADPDDWFRALDRYYSFDYDLGAQDMADTMAYLRTIDGGNGRVGAVGYCLGGKMCYLMCCRTDIDCAVAYYATYMEHNIGEAPKLHRPFMLHQAMQDQWVPPAICAFIHARISPNPLVEIHQYPDADHAFARKGGTTYRAPEAERAHQRTLAFLARHLGT